MCLCWCDLGLSEKEECDCVLFLYEKDECARACAILGGLRRTNVTVFLFLFLVVVVVVLSSEKDECACVLFAGPRTDERGCD